MDINGWQGATNVDDDRAGRKQGDLLLTNKTLCLRGVRQANEEHPWLLDRAAYRPEP